jgi:hypothetical protein
VKGARIGVIRSLFGTAAEDEEVGGIVQRALDSVKKAGAEVSDVTIPGLDDLLRNSSMINSDFKFDLAEYLASAEHAPVRSLGEILDRGLYHAALETTFRARNAVESRESEQSRRARVRRDGLRTMIEAVLEEHRLVALVYPTLRRKPARIGDAQGGTTCQVSAHSGLPALGIPAGFTDDGVPIGMDLLGAAFTEQALLSLGYAIERTLDLRRPPFSTPALLGGTPPPGRSTRVASDGAVVDVTYDEMTSQLRYAVKLDPAARDQLTAVWIHAGTASQPAAARHRLFAAGLPLTGSVRLSYRDRHDLANGGLRVRFFNRGGQPAGDLLLEFGPRPMREK